MTTIANLLVQIGADISDLKRGLNEAGNQISGFGDRVANGFGSVGSSISRVGAQMSNLTAPLADFGRAGINTAATFQASMAEISARTGIVGAGLEEISAFALQMGADTAFSAQQAADGFLQLLSSGQSAEQAMATLPLVLDAAAASGEGLGTTADTLTDILAAFGLPIDAMTPQLQAAAKEFGVSAEMMEAWGNNAFDTTPQLTAMANSLDLTTDELAKMIFETEDAASVVDTLAQAAGASSADMASLGQGFANVGGITSGFGLTVEDTAAVLAIFAENGTKGAEAGTALKSVLLNMTRPTEAVQAAWAEMGEVLSMDEVQANFNRTQAAMGELGLSMYDATGNARPFEEVIGDVDRALDALPLQEQNRLMYELAGSYGIVGLKALRGETSIEDMKESMAGQASAATVAAARMDTFNGRIDSLMGSVETLMITALTPLMENVLTPMAEQFTAIINKVTEWAGANPQLAGTLVAIGGALTLLGPALVGIGVAISLAAPAFGLLAGAFAILVSPLALVAAGIAGLAVVASQFIDFGALAENIRTGIASILQSLNLENLNLDGLKTAFTDALAGLFPEGGGIDLSGFQESITGSFSTLDFSGVGATMQQHFDEILGAIITVAGLVFGGPVGLAIGGAKLVASAIENDFLGIGTFLNTSGITEAVNGALAGVKAAIEAAIQGVFGGGAAAGLSGGEFGMAGMTEAMFGGLGGGGIPAPLQTFIDDLKMGFEYLQGVVTEVWGNIQPGLQALGDGLKGFIENLAGAETGGLLRVVTVVGGAIGGLVAEVMKVGSDIFGGILANIGGALPGLGEAISGFVTAISNVGEGDIAGALGGLADGLLGLGESILNFIGIDIELPDFAGMIAAWQDVFGQIPAVIEVARMQIESALDDIATSVRSFIRDIQVQFANIQMTAAGAQVASGLGDVAAAQATFTQASGFIQAADIAKKLESDINASLASGGALQIDLPTLEWVTSPAASAKAGYDVVSQLASAIADPTAIQNAMTAAIGTADTSAMTALIPLTLELASDPKAQMQELLMTALAAGGEGGAAYQALLPMATELQIDTDNIVQQYQAEIAAAASVRTFDATVNANIIVNAASVQFPQFSGSGDFMIPGGPGIPQFASGGMMNETGLAYLHAGERVLNPAETKAYNAGAGNSSSGGNVVNIYGVQDVDALLFELQRRGIALA